MVAKMKSLVISDTFKTWLIGSSLICVGAYSHAEDVEPGLWILEYKRFDKELKSKRIYVQEPSADGALGLTDPNDSGTVYLREIAVADGQLKFLLGRGKQACSLDIVQGEDTDVRWSGTCPPDGDVESRDTLEVVFRRPEGQAVVGATEGVDDKAKGGSLGPGSDEETALAE